MPVTTQTTTTARLFTICWTSQTDNYRFDDRTLRNFIQGTDLKEYREIENAAILQPSTLKISTSSSANDLQVHYLRECGNNCAAIYGE